MMPAILTTVPAVLLALVKLGQESLPDILTTDGPGDTDNFPPEYLIIGYAADEDEAAVEGATIDEGNHTSSESYVVRCMVSVATGDTDAAATAGRRARVAELFGAFALALRSDPSLGGVLTGGAGASLGSWSWVYGPAADGSFAEVDFEVNISAGYLGMS